MKQAESVKKTDMDEDQYPSVFKTPEERKRYDDAKAEISQDMEKLIQDCRNSERITAKDLAIVINAR